MMTLSRVALSLILAVSTVAGLCAAEPLSSTPFQSIKNFDSRLLAPEPTVSTSVLMDAMYDYEVYSAPDVTGQTDIVIIARFADDGQWDYVHQYTWIGTPDHGMSLSDQGVWKFKTWWSAYQAAENLMDEGEITDYEIIEEPKEPQWTYEDTFDTRAQAEAFAEEIEYWSHRYGDPHITKIVKVGSFSLSTRTLR